MAALLQQLVGVKWGRSAVKRRPRFTVVQPVARSAAQPQRNAASAQLFDHSHDRRR